MASKSFVTLLFSLQILLPWLSLASPHPLDPLTPDEIATVRRVVLSSPLATSPTSLSFHYVGLDEPDKPEILAWVLNSNSRGRRPALPLLPRRALVLARANAETHELVVDIANASLLSVRAHSGHGFPILTLEEQAEAAALPLSYPPFVDSARRRGVALEDVVCSTFTAGWFGEEGKRRRLVVLCFVAGETVNLYARPMEGIKVVVDLDEMRIVEYRDRVAPPVPKAEGTDYRVGERRPAAGMGKGKRGFDLDGNVVRYSSFCWD